MSQPPGRTVFHSSKAARTVGGSAGSSYPPNDVKLRSCATSCAGVLPPGSVFERLLGKYFEGVGDEKTLRLLGIARGAE